MKTVGYFEGTDTALLTALVANGFGTLPLANDWDSHGKNASRITPRDVNLIVGYLHKIVPPTLDSSKEQEKSVPVGVEKTQRLRPFEFLYSAKANNIPVFVVVFGKYHEAAKKILGEAADLATLVKPEELEDKVREFLEY